MAKRTCTVDDCERNALARGYCSRHYQLWWAHGTPTPAPKPPRDRRCDIDGCDGEHVARGLCGKHYQRLLATGSTDDPAPFVPSACTVDGCEGVILARGWCVTHYNCWQKHGDPLWVREKAACSHGDCERPVNAYGLCELHLRRKRKGTDMDAPVRGVPRPCSEDGCDERSVCRGLCQRHYYEQHTKPKAAEAERRRREKRAQEDPAERKRRRNAHYRANREQIRAAAKRRYDRVYAEDPSSWRAAKSRRKMRGAARMTAEDKRIAVSYRSAIRNDPCFYCGSPETHHTDHFFPLAKGGTDRWENLVRACRRCNLSKHARCGTWFMLMRRPDAESGLPAAVA